MGGSISVDALLGAKTSIPKIQQTSQDSATAKSEIEFGLQTKCDQCLKLQSVDDPSKIGKDETEKFLNCSACKILKKYAANTEKDFVSEKSDETSHEIEIKSENPEVYNSTETGAILKRGIKFENEKEFDEYMLSNLNFDKKKKKNKSPEKKLFEFSQKVDENVKKIVQEFVPNPDSNSGIDEENSKSDDKNEEFLPNPDSASGIDLENSKSDDKNEDMETITSLVTDRVPKTRVSGKYLHTLGKWV